MQNPNTKFKLIRNSYSLELVIDGYTDTDLKLILQQLVASGIIPKTDK